MIGKRHLIVGHRASNGESCRFHAPQISQLKFVFEIKPNRILDSSVILAGKYSNSLKSLLSSN
jgi:hypothetical protein